MDVRSELWVAYAAVDGRYIHPNQPVVDSIRFTNGRMEANPGPQAVLVDMARSLHPADLSRTDAEYPDKGQIRVLASFMRPSNGDSIWVGVTTIGTADDRHLVRLVYTASEVLAVKYDSGVWLWTKDLDARFTMRL